MTVGAFPTLQAPSYLSTSVDNYGVTATFFVMQTIFAAYNGGVFPTPGGSPALFVPSVDKPSVVSATLKCDLATSTGSSSG